MHCGLADVGKQCACRKAHINEPRWHRNRGRQLAAAWRVQQAGPARTSHATGAEEICMAVPEGEGASQASEVLGQSIKEGGRRASRGGINGILGAVTNTSAWLVDVIRGSFHIEQLMHIPEKGTGLENTRIRVGAHRGDEV